MNYPLIEIRTIPIELEMKVTPAKLNYSRGTAEVEISRDKGGMSIKSRPIKINIDTFEARNSLSPTTARSIQQGAQKGKERVYEATAQYAERGKLLLQAKIGEEMITQFSKESTNTANMDFAMDFLPKGGANITWDQGEMQIRYEMDKVNMDWRMQQSDFEFTPGDIEFTVKQQPDVVIKYVGEPIYIPASANPNYEPVDVKA